MKAIVISTEGLVSLSEKPPAQSTYEWLRELVGGYLEGFPTPWGECDGWLDEDGKCKELDANVLATYLLKRAGLLLPGDYIAGPLVITGGCDAEGETLGLTDDQVGVIRLAMREALLL